MSLIKQKIKEGWADPSPHGESPQERENIISSCFKTAASIHQEEAVECPKLLGGGSHFISLKLLHFLGLRGPKAYTVCIVTVFLLQGA